MYRRNLRSDSDKTMSTRCLSWNVYPPREMEFDRAILMKKNAKDERANGSSAILAGERTGATCGHVAIVSERK